VDAYAIAASLSIENPTHEHVAAKAIELLDRELVVCSIGDSLVRLNQSGQLSVGPLRVQPLAMSQSNPDPARWIGVKNSSRWIISAISNEQVQPNTLDVVVAHLLSEKGQPQLI
jgi:hypothetical protein